MQPLTAVVIGATGLVGEEVLNQLLSDPAFETVRILTRRPVRLNHPKLDKHIIDFEDLVDFRKKLGTGDVIFCCVGTTKSKVKGKMDAYRKVDVDIPVNTAKLASSAGFSTYVLISSVGADEKSGNYYLRFKGEAEKEIAAQQFEHFHVFRPGLLLGDRKENRFGEGIAKFLMGVFGVFMIGKYKKYKAISSSVLAKAMIKAAKSGTMGMTIHHYSDIKKLAE